MSTFIKIRPVGAELFYADGRTDGHDVAFHNFANAHKKVGKNYCFFLTMYAGIYTYVKRESCYLRIYFLDNNLAVIKFRFQLLTSCNLRTFP